MKRELVYCEKQNERFKETRDISHTDRYSTAQLFLDVGLGDTTTTQETDQKLIITVRMGLINMSSADNCVTNISGNYISRLIGKKK